MTPTTISVRRAALAASLAATVLANLAVPAAHARADTQQGESGAAAAQRAGGNREEPYRDPTSAAARSLVFPGWGQHYNGEPTKGTLFTFGVATGALFAFELLQLASSERGQEFERGVGVAIMALTWTWSIADAYIVAPRINAENGYDLGVLPPAEPDVRVTLLSARF